MRGLKGTGHHRRHRDAPEPEPAPERERVRARAAGGDLTVDELRGFLADVDEAAERLGADPGRLRLWVAVRMSGAVRAVSVDIPPPKPPKPKGGKPGAA